jgi:DNA modification methylase
MAQLLKGDCLKEMEEFDNESIDLIFCDLPYGQTACSWDSLIDLDKFWKEIMRIKKLNTPIFMTTTTKFGISLINSAPKKCPFRYDIVWEKSSPCGFLNARKFPMRKHEMIYVFYEKLPMYDLSSHTHKFVKMSKGRFGNCYADPNGKVDEAPSLKYDPPLPVSVVKEEPQKITKVGAKSLYGTIQTHQPANDDGTRSKYRGQSYDPPLPVSVVKEEKVYGDNIISHDKEHQKNGRKSGESVYDPPLPVSVVKEDVYNVKARLKNGKLKSSNKEYTPPLPTSVVKEPEPEPVSEGKYIPPGARESVRDEDSCYGSLKYESTGSYDPPLPNSMLKIKSTRGKHATEKPVALMEWILKYFSKEGDVVLDPTMGSGSTGVACKNMNRNFIGIEMNDEIFEVACERVWG